MIGYGVTLGAGRTPSARSGAWIVLILLFVVGMLLYFNMTVGDVVAAWLQRRDERDELAGDDALTRRRRGAPAAQDGRRPSRRRSAAPG